MSGMSEKERQVKKGIKVLTELDLCILKGLYEYRAFSTEQVQRRYGLTYWYTYKKLQLLRESGLISSHTINGYEKGSGNQGKYHRITTKGLMVLKEHGVNVDKKMQQLEVAEKQIPFLLATNDIMVDLEPYGWVLSDSREVKERFHTNRSDLVQGTLQNAHTNSKEYALYTFLHTTSEKNVAKMVREMKNYTDMRENSGKLRDYIIFTRGRDSLEKVVDYILNKTELMVLARVGSLKIFPFTFGKYYLRKFDDESEVRSYVGGTLGNEIVFRRILGATDVRAKYAGLNCIVEHRGEEKYFMNLVDMDLKKVFHIQQYHRDDFEQDGRKVLVCALNNMQVDFYRKLFKNYHHVEILIMDGDEMIDYLSSVPPINYELNNNEK